MTIKGKGILIISIIVSILLIDQILKVYIKTHLGYGEGFKILGFNWARIYFIENEGMAYGMKIGGQYGKLILSLFRIIMVAILGVFIFKWLKNGEKTSLLISFALIMAGAMGNIIDSAFYGLFFSATPEFHGEVAKIVPFGQGYAGFLHGKVVDMFYFPMINTILPDWVPFLGGERFVFFQPVFNVADSSITTGVASLLLFNRKFFSNSKSNSQVEEK